jgi:hypothetical protein
LNGVTIITCTGGRAESIRRCARYVHRFKGLGNQPVQWIVVDDGEVQTHVPYMGDNAVVEERLVRPKHRWQPGMNTLALNLLAAIPHVKWDRVLFVEDDDWYHASYMARQSSRLDSSDIAGDMDARYYHIPSRRFKVFNCAQHASLAQTAIRSSLLPVLADVCASGTDFIDVRLWKLATKPHKSITFAANAGHHVGLKGLPGRAGIGVGHRPGLFGADWKHDPNHDKLREWLGVDVLLYMSASEAVFNRTQSLQGASTAI